MADESDDIAKYLNGELTPSEMHAMEKKALHDPFLKDALEGTVAIKPGDFATDLKTLEEKLEQRVHGRSGKVISFWVWPARIAAGLLVILVATFVIVRLSSKTPSEELASNSEIAPTLQEKDEKTGVASSDTVVEENGNLLSLAEPNEVESKLAPKPPQKQETVDFPQSAASQPGHEAEQLVAEATISEEDDTPAEIAAEEKNVLAPRARANPQDELRETASKKLSLRARETDHKAAAGASVDQSTNADASNSRIIKGQVKSINGVAIPGVNVIIKGTNMGTVTNASGLYQISVDEQNPTLIFSFIGFSRTEIAAGPHDQINIQLTKDVSQRSEVVVVGYGTAPKADDFSFSNLELASPDGGLDAYREYLENNLQYPTEAMDKNIEGEVTIQFTVEPAGQITAFKVIQGLGYGCDEEVIRLIQAGPDWAPTKRNNDSVGDTVKVRVKFTLPKK